MVSFGYTDTIVEGRKGGEHTLLEGLDLVKRLPLRLVTLLLLGNLDRLAELLEITLLAGLGGGLLVGGLLDQLGLDLLHLAVALDHLGEIVIGAGERHAFLEQRSTAELGGFEGLGVEGQLALEVVLDVLDGLGGRLGGDDGLVGGEFDGGVRGHADSVEGREEGGLVVDCCAGEGDEVLALFVV